LAKGGALAIPPLCGEEGGGVVSFGVARKGRVVAVRPQGAIFTVMLLLMAGPND
jgi:hypothetical protein